VTSPRAIAFDLWETLITDTPELSKAQERLRLQRMAQILGRSDIEPAYRHIWHHCQNLYWSKDEDIPCRRQVEHFVEALNVTVDEDTLDKLEHAYAMAAVEIPPALVAGADEVIPALKEKGFKVGMISNTGRTPGYALREVLNRLGIGSFIDAMVFSNEHGACKPQRSIFEALRAALGVAYDEMVFVGDNLYVDVHGAQRCGMTAVHFVPPQRGTAIAPPVDHGLEIVPDVTITDLRELYHVAGIAAEPVPLRK
jgi:putative hydrolase of the HAD superfamily